MTCDAPKMVKLPPVMCTSPANTTRPVAFTTKSPFKAMSPWKLTSLGKSMTPAATTTPSTVKPESGSSTFPTSDEKPMRPVMVMLPGAFTCMVSAPSASSPLMKWAELPPKIKSPVPSEPAVATTLPVAMMESSKNNVSLTVTGAAPFQ